MRYEVEIDGDHFDLPACAMQLRMTASGASDRWGQEEAKEAADHLRHRIETWTPPKLEYARFDNAVKEMCLAAIEEYEDSWLCEEGP